MHICHLTRFSLILAVLATVFFVGCKDDGLEKVTGTVTLEGEPLADALIEFIPMDDMGSSSMGRTDESGSFVMEFSSSHTGAVPGEYVVQITTHDIADPQNNIPAKPERVPAKYNKKSELTATVVEGQKNHFEFNLESGEVVQPPIDDDAS